MFSSDESTTVICLFHHGSKAEAALRDLERSGVPASAISLIGPNDTDGQSSSQLAAVGVPSRDLEHLQRGVENGGMVVAVWATSEHLSIVERIFGEHRARKIDEAASKDPEDDLTGGAAAVESAGAATVPIIDEELVVGTRTVDRGGVRVYRRVVEMPAEDALTLREEHVVIERKVVDRPATAADLQAADRHPIELTETAEEAVVYKTARVVEEVLVSRRAGERVEHIRDTVRRTEVDIEQLPTGDITNVNRRPV